MVLATLQCMEKIAITEWNGVVSPVYDMACRLLIRDESGKEYLRDVSTMSINQKSHCCENEHVTTLICGAISSRALSILNERDIKVIYWICGPVKKITDAYFNGVELEKEFPMPGGMGLRCGEKRHWCGRKISNKKCTPERKRRNGRNRNENHDNSPGA